MRFRIVTVAILLAVASRGYGRPRDPDPLDISKEAVAGSTVTTNGNGSLDSRYMMMRRTTSTSPTSMRRRDISITSVKYGNGNNKSNWQGRTILPVLSLDTGRKNYLPLGALSSASPRSKSNNNNNYQITNKGNRQPIGRSYHNPMMIPFIPSVQISTPLPIPVYVPQNNKVTIVNSTVQRQRKLQTPLGPIPIPFIMHASTPQNNKVLMKNITLKNEQKSSLALPMPVPIPKSIVPISQKTKVENFNSTSRGERKITSRNIVRIIPQKIKPVHNLRRNFTNFKIKPQVSNVQLKNWPNEAVQNVQDLFNYEKYTSFMHENIEEKNKVVDEKSKVSSNREPLIKSPEIQPVRWTRIPIVEPTTPSIDRIETDSVMHNNNHLDDLGSNNINTIYNKLPQPNPTSEVDQNTIVHILNAGSRKPNVTVTKPANIMKIDKTKPSNSRPPQNVHIMFMMDKDGNETSNQQRPPAEILETGNDCPTIMINSITQINNTIESKEGCTDLNIVINSHVLNTNIFKPPIGQTGGVSGSESLKDPYTTSGTSSDNYYQSNEPSNNYQNNNNYGNDKNPGGQTQSDEPQVPQSPGPTPEISTFEVFQGTHINVGGNLPSDTNIPNDEGVPGSDDSTGTDIDGSPLTDAEEGSNDITGTSPEEGTSSDGSALEEGSTATGDLPSPAAADPGGSAVQAAQPALAAGAPGDVGQANDAPGAVSLPNLPNIPNLPRPGQLTNLASNLGSGGSGGQLGGSSQNGLAPVTSVDDDDDDEDDILEAMSPANLLDSISSVFTYFSVLNPINYGIFGMAVAPFVAFAAGVVGVAAFLFPWAFPGSLDLARGWDDSSSQVRIRFNPSLRDVVQSSIHKYRHLNEWKGRRRKRKRKR